MYTRNHQRNWGSKFGLRICKDPDLLTHVQMERQLSGLDRKGQRAVRRALKRRFRGKGMRFYSVGNRLVIQTDIPTQWKTRRECTERDQHIEQVARWLATAIAEEAQNYDSRRRQSVAPDPWEYNPPELTNFSSAV